MSARKFGRIALYMLVTVAFACGTVMPYATHDLEATILRILCGLITVILIIVIVDVLSSVEGTEEEDSVE